MRGPGSAEPSATLTAERIAAACQCQWSPARAMMSLISCCQPDSWPSFLWTGSSNRPSELTMDFLDSSPRRDTRRWAVGIKAVERPVGDGGSPVREVYECDLGANRTLVVVPRHGTVLSQEWTCNRDTTLAWRIYEFRSGQS
jgi:hypothetical protein